MKKQTIPRVYIGDSVRAKAIKEPKVEEEFYNFLIGEFDEIAIHEHKIIRPGNVASDVFIYLDQEATNGIVIDLFYAQDLITLLKIVTIKAKRYATLPYKIYFVLVGNDTISDIDIDLRIANKQVPLPSHIRVLTETAFKGTIVPMLKNKSRFAK